MDHEGKFPGNFDPGSIPGNFGQHLHGQPGNFPGNQENVRPGNRPSHFENLGLPGFSGGPFKEEVTVTKSLFVFKIYFFYKQS